MRVPLLVIAELPDCFEPWSWNDEVVKELAKQGRIVAVEKLRPSMVDEGQRKDTAR